ncbi:hypothetical protein A3K34_01105 [candidate division WWE3 bacterium RIFOXYC1_FULL_40_10]|uniref:ABC transporter permease n=1 Tax=candidate division WWE3 bacterium RIFOXYA2_FULL_46_9 TaxID=1802636 RepID=A0A1F4W210_UNCKA|nr:MAG: hypothetical protein A3K58_01105 [candidate division WWE3 bacterium RIFOXYB1_FULL_40_22]OGC61467.1 MAG: hypothetical protein A3K37_01105 [candidate division WWE3 bacterium RIFOXYA1_FULL_40_11]OGC63400.1 MAG: hypothetical protein A2264_01580 [candidate division WWE3 bacterium RIFOXYA2_FULL_46_9]OGC64569.1 MAG: hypothetical protein A2326_03655 [candidate division WWE3 bacterium RIFOXYB2_FULL_41_6]OGC65850.1 MAG: hypothetical protein A3K34_01105 [candidate division WWE3 bacterium RIFOXYC1_
MQAARKYFSVLKTGVLNQASYRTRFFGNTLGNIAYLVVYLFLWKYVFSSQSTIQGYTLGAMMTYYVLTFLLKSFTNNNGISWVLSDHIRDGTLSNLLLKPISYNLYMFLNSFASQMLAVIFPIIFMIAATVLYSDTIKSPTNPGIFILVVLLSTMLNHLIFSLIGLISFWTIKSWGILSLFGRFADILNGSIFPLDFLPGWAIGVLNYLPFKYMMFVPVSVYLGRLEMSPALILIQLAWIAGLLALYLFLWPKAMKNYEAVGN